MKMAILLFSSTIFLLLSSILNAGEINPDLKTIESIDDLPRFTYEVQTTLTDLVTSEEQFSNFASRVRKDIENVLETYEIEDKTTLKNYLRVLKSLDMLEGNFDKVITKIDKIRELEDKQSKKLMVGVIDKAIIKAFRDVGRDDEKNFKKTFSQYLSDAIAELPWEVIQEEIEETRGRRMELLSENVLLGAIKAEFEPAVEKNHQISNDVAEQIVGIHYALKIQLPLKDEIISVYDKYIEENRFIKHDIWKEREVVLRKEGNLEDVIIAIWDTGVDVEVFEENLFINKNEQINGKDDDNNGFVDDVHGIAYTLEEEKTTELLYPIENAEERLTEMKKMMKGLLDMDAAINSPEAQSLKQEVLSMNTEEIKKFMEDLYQFIFYIHGTYVGGIAIKGNPFAEILVARLTADYRTIPISPTVERAEKSAKMYREVVRYFKDNGVHVVNMSWGGTLRETESALEANGIGKNAEERAKIAREIFDIEKKAIYDAIKNAPEILFVTAAGNENDDVSFEDYYPAAFDLPNILVVGAVDKAGDVTSFTSFGDRVDVYANGFEVESYIPGGGKLSSSGTSASSPNAANLAAKLISLDGSLNPDKVISLIKEGADRNKDGKLLLINPRKSLELLETSMEIKNRTMETEDIDIRDENRYLENER
jgi:hypothetical protein